jgi:undecaprenyl-diphosphatase
LTSLGSLQASDLPLFATGFVAAFISAILAIKYFVKLVQRYTFTPFGWYRIALAIVVVLIVV